MPDQLVNTFSMDTDVAVIEGRKHQYLHSPEAEELIKRGALQALAMQIHVVKGNKGMDCIKQVDQHAIDCIAGFTAEAFRVVERGLYSSQDEQACVQAAVGRILVLHNDAIGQLTHLVDGNIAEVATRPIPVGSQKKWWQR